MQADVATFVLFGAALCVVASAANARRERQRRNTAEGRIGRLVAELAALRNVEPAAERDHDDGPALEGEAHWRSLTEALPLLIWTAKADGTVEYLSGRAREYTGLTEQELLGDGWANAIRLR